jgi:hypothetical protein
MRASSVVVLAVVVEDALNLSLVDGDHVIQALAPERSDDSLAVPVLPRRGPCRNNRFQTETLCSRPKLVSPIDPITIPDEESDVRIPRQRCASACRVTPYRRPSVTPTIPVQPSVVTQDLKHRVGSGLGAESGQSWKPTLLV